MKNKLFVLCMIVVLLLPFALIFTACDNSLGMAKEHSDSNTVEVTKNTIDDIDIPGYMPYGENEYSTKYETKWRSEDGNIEFTLNNKIGIYGDGVYSGKYCIDGQVYDISVSQEYDPYSESDGFIVISKNLETEKEWNEQYIAAGDYFYDPNNETIELIVDVFHSLEYYESEGIDCEEYEELYAPNPYRKGDKIKFYQVME